MAKKDEAKATSNTQRVRLGSDAAPLPPGPLVAGSVVVEIPDEAHQRSGFDTDHHHLLTNGGYGFKYVKGRASGSEE